MRRLLILSVLRSIHTAVINSVRTERITTFPHASPRFVNASIRPCATHVYIISSKKIGYMLLFAQIFSAFILAFIVRFYLKSIRNSHRFQSKKTSFASKFTDVVSQSSTAMISICGYVLFFAVLTAYSKYFFAENPFAQYIVPLLEISNGIFQSKNIYFISFLVGFAGVSVWCQVLSFSKDFAVNYGKFVLYRLLHGLIFAGTMKIEMMIFQPKISVFSNHFIPRFHQTYSTVMLSFSLLLMLILLFLVLYGKKEGGNLKNDMI